MEIPQLYRATRVIDRSPVCASLCSFLLAGAISPKAALPAYAIAFTGVAIGSYLLKVTSDTTHKRMDGYTHSCVLYCTALSSDDENEIFGCLSTLYTSLCDFERKQF